MHHSSAARLNNFDLLRLAAASQVLLTHGVYHLKLRPPAWWPVVESLHGVPIFFVISGFLISASYERSSGLADYFTKRAARIYPALWCCILVTVGVAAAFGFNFLHPSGLAWFVAQCIGLIYTPGFLKDFGFGSYNGALWTIPVELQFYIALPALYWLVRRFSNPRAAIVAAWVLFLAIAVAFHVAFVGPEGRVEKLIRYSFLPHFFMFLSGVLLQKFAAHRRHWVAGKGLWWLAAYLALVNLLPDTALLNFTGRLLLAVAVIALAYTAPSLAHSALRGQDISYGIYIYHGLFLNVLIQLGLTGKPDALALLVGLTLVAATLSWAAVEQPMLRWKRVPLERSTLTDPPQAL